MFQSSPHDHHGCQRQADLLDPATARSSVHIPPLGQFTHTTPCTRSSNRHWASIGGFSSCIVDPSSSLHVVLLCCRLPHPTVADHNPYGHCSKSGPGTVSIAGMAAPRLRNEAPSSRANAHMQWMLMAFERTNLSRRKPGRALLSLPVRGRTKGGRLGSRTRRWFQLRRRQITSSSTASSQPHTTCLCSHHGAPVVYPSRQYEIGSNS